MSKILSQMTNILWDHCRSYEISADLVRSQKILRDLKIFSILIRVCRIRSGLHIDYILMFSILLPIQWYLLRNPKIKKLLEARLDSNWKNLRVTKNNFHLKVKSCQHHVLNSRTQISDLIPSPPHILPVYRIWKKKKLPKRKKKIFPLNV